MKAMTKIEKQKLDRAHLDALPILIIPLKDCIASGVPITRAAAVKILSDWDKCRVPKI